MIRKLLNILNKKNIEKSIKVLTMTLLCRTAKYPPELIKFEYKFTSYFGNKYGLSFSNATSTFEAAIFALGLKKGDKVIVSSLSFYSFINALLQNGIDLIYMDFDENLQIKIDENKIDEKVKMILVTHLFGIPQNIKKIISIAKKNNLKIIEDCSHAHGAILNGQYLGTFGDVGIFSLQGDKAVSGGEGGMAISNKKNIYEKMKLYGHMGRDLSDVNFLDEIKSTGLGKKFRMHPLAAGLAIIELKYLKTFNKKLNKNILKLRNSLKNYSNIKFIDTLKFSEMGGFYYGYPLWLKKGNKDFLLSNWPNIFKDYPYPLYHQKKYFTLSEIFLKAINGEKVINNKTNLYLFNTEQANERLIFIDYNFLKNYNLRKAKLIQKIFCEIQ